MLSEDFQRISEPRAFALSFKAPPAYFQPDDTKLSDPRKRGFFLEIERDLRGLDDDTWNFLRQEAFSRLQEAFPRLKAKDPDRSWPETGSVGHQA
jgi:hypothetical protein